MEPTNGAWHAASGWWRHARRRWPGLAIWSVCGADSLSHQMLPYFRSASPVAPSLFPRGVRNNHWSACWRGRVAFPIRPNRLASPSFPCLPLIPRARSLLGRRATIRGNRSAVLGQSHYVALDRYSQKRVYTHCTTELIWAVNQDNRQQATMTTTNNRATPNATTTQRKRKNQLLRDRNFIVVVNTLNFVTCWW